MSLRRLNLAPDVQGYQIAEPTGHVYTKLAGGASRIRRDFDSAPVEIDVQWTCDEQEYNYLTTFHRVTANEPFTMALIVHSPEFTDHEVRFVPASFKTSNIQGRKYVVRAKLEVVPLVSDLDFDEGLVTTFEAFGQEGPAAYGLLTQLVNVDMPGNLK